MNKDKIILMISIIINLITGYYVKNTDNILILIGSIILFIQSILFTIFLLSKVFRGKK